MSEEFKKLNKTIASFMLTSLAISGSAFAQANGNLIADAMGNVVPQVNPALVRELYGVPTPPTNELYGVPTPPPAIEPLYAVPNDPPVNILYGIPINDPPVNLLYGIPIKNPPVNLLYGIPIKSVPDVPVNADKINNQQIYNTPSKDTEVNFGKSIPTGRIIKDKDSKVPVNYVAPVIIPGYYIPDSK